MPVELPEAFEWIVGGLLILALAVLEVVRSVGAATILVAVLLGVPLWWYRRWIRRDLQRQQRQIYNFMAAACAAGCSRQWTYQAVSCRYGCEPEEVGELFSDLKQQRAAIKSYQEYLNTLRGLGRTPREIRRDFRQLGFPIPPELRRESARKGGA
jgi:hypothetical protein